MEYIETVPVEDYSWARQLRWLSWPVLLLSVGLPAAIIATVESEHLAGAMIAYVNCVIIFWLIVHLLRRDPLLGLLPVIALPTLSTAWPVSSLYFAIFHVPMTYSTFVSHILDLQGFLKVQTVVLLFLAGYVPVLLIFFHRRPPEQGPPIANPRSFATLCVLICLAVIGLHDITRVTMSESAALAWLACGLFNYTNSLMLVGGALIQYLRSTFKWLVVIVLVGNLGLNMVANARGYGFYPIMYFVAGYLFLSNVPQRRKLLLVGILGVLFPVFIVAGNTTRTVLGTIGFQNFSHRLDVLMTSAPTGGGGAAMAATMGRLFMTGGHNIITTTPDEIPYYEFSPVAYITEMGTSLLPGALYFQPEYRTNRHLLRYHMNVIFSSIEISLIGHFWMLGGWVIVFIGGLATGALNGAAMQVIRRARSVSMMKALIYVGILASGMFEVFGQDFISDFRIVVWRLMLAVLLYQAFRVLLPQGDDPRLLAGAGSTAYQGQIQRYR